MIWTLGTARVSGRVNTLCEKPDGEDSMAASSVLAMLLVTLRLEVRITTTPTTPTPVSLTKEIRIVTNTDDFLIRMVKGCAQLGQMPDIYNTVNMVPVDHVARVVVACAFTPPTRPLSVAHVTSHPRLSFTEFLGTLKTFGYEVEKVDYIPWRIALETHVVEKSKDNAL